MLDATVASVEDARRFVRTKRRAFSVALYSRSENNWRVVLSDASEDDAPIDLLFFNLSSSVVGTGARVPY